MYEILDRKNKVSVGGNIIMNADDLTEIKTLFEIKTLTKKNC